MVFYSDLDNTLIYSYKRKIGEEKRCVEVYQGREVSFMTERSWRLLRKVSQKALFVPVTTRSVEQYHRVDLGIGTPSYALACNGGVLLADGQKDLAWYGESRKIVSGCQGELHRAKEALQRDGNRSFEIRDIERLFLFTKSASPEQTVRDLQNVLDHQLVDVFSNGVKVYVVPKVLTKGNAVRRLQERLQREGGSAAGKGRKLGQKEAGLWESVIAAGDSEFDIPMLQEADIALAPKEMQEKGIQMEHMVFMGREGVFSDFVLEYVSRQMQL